MFRIKAWVRAFFGFSRRETNAFLLLLPLMVIILFSEPVYRHWQSRVKPDYSKDEQQLDSLMATLIFIKTDSVIKEEVPTSPPAFFAFDPNTVSEKKLVELGLSAFMANRIERYRNKGGRFKKKEDILKIYGMDSTWFAKAEPWITITASNIVRIPKTPLPFKPFEKKSVSFELIDINVCDTAQLMKVYGIGPALSKRICTFRDRLGGFISMNQLKEVYGLDTTIVKELNRKFFIAEDFLPPKININTMKTEDIRHPYIKWKEAKAIVAYRQQHGTLTSLELLKEIKNLSREWIEKATPYLTVD